MNLLHLFEASLLGIVQGLTEFLPVSSTGHLVILQHWFGLNENTYGLAFDMFINLGTTAALIWYFRKDLWEILMRLRIPTSGKPLTETEKLPWWIAGVTVIVGLAGLKAQKYVESDTVRSLGVIAATLAVFGLLMLLAERYAAKQQKDAPLTASRAYGVGLAQILAFVPGVSRSGATIVTGMFSGLNRTTATRYSFLLSAPITLAVSLKSLAEFLKDIGSVSGEIVAFYVIGMLFSAIFGYWSIKFLLQYLSKHSLSVFAYYRLGVAAVLVIYLLATR